MKIELVCAPGYGDKDRWPNNIASDFDPYRADGDEPEPLLRRE